MRYLVIVAVVLSACQQTEPGAARKAGGAAIEGVKGESTDKGHKKELELEKHAPKASEAKWYVPE